MAIFKWFQVAGRTRVAIAMMTVALLIGLADPPSGAASSAPAKNAEAPPGGASDIPANSLLASVLRSFDKAQRETTSLVAGFTEKKELKLLARPVLSRGEFFYQRPN